MVQDTVARTLIAELIYTDFPTSCKGMGEVILFMDWEEAQLRGTKEAKKAFDLADLIQTKLEMLDQSRSQGNNATWHQSHPESMGR